VKKEDKEIFVFYHPTLIEQPAVSFINHVLEKINFFWFSSLFARFWLLLLLLLGFLFSPSSFMGVIFACMERGVHG